MTVAEDREEEAKAHVSKREHEQVTGVMSMTSETGEFCRTNVKKRKSSSFQKSMSK